MKKIYLFSALLLSFFVSLLTMDWNSSVVKYNQQINFLDSTSSSYIVFHTGDSNLENDFYYLNSSHSLSSSNKKIKTDILMLKNDIKYSFLNLTIKNGEVWISNNLALKYDLKIYDKIILKSAYYSNDITYTITNIILNCYGISTDYFTNENGIVILGNDSRINENLADSILFAKEEQKINSLNIKKIISNDKTINDLNKSIKIIFLINSVFTFIGCFVLLYLMYSLDKKTLNYKIKCGYTISKLTMSYPLFYISAFLVYVLGINIFTLIEQSIKFHSLILVKTILLQFLIIFIFIPICLLILKKNLRRT